MSDPADLVPSRLRRQRRIGAAMLAAFVVWGVVQFAGARLGMATRWVALVDLATLAVLGWAVVAALGLWRSRKE